MTIPPTSGAAMRFMISDPVPLDHSIGISPVLIVAKVINFGRKRLAIAELFGGEDQHLRAGALASITLPNQSTEYLARVADILPQVDPQTRAVCQTWSG